MTKKNWLIAGLSVLAAVLLAAVVTLSVILLMKDGGGPDKGDSTAVTLADALLCEVTLPPGWTLRRTEESLLKVREIAGKIPGVKHVLLVPGRTLTCGRGKNLGLAIIELEDCRKRKTPDLQIDAIRKKLAEQCQQLENVEVQIFLPPPIRVLGAAGGVSFTLQMTGERRDPHKLHLAKELVIREIMKSKKARYAVSSYDRPAPVLILRIKEWMTKAIGVDVKDIDAVLRSTFGSDAIKDINKDGKTYQIEAQAVEIFRSDPNKIDQLHVRSRSGNPVLLSALAECEWTLDPQQAERYDKMFPCVNIKVQELPGVSTEEMKNTIRKIVDKLGKDYQLSWTEMSSEERQNREQVIYFLILALAKNPNDRR